MFKEKIQNLVKKKVQGNNKKNIENLVVFLILLIITVMAINVIWNKEEEEEKENTANYKILAENTINSSNISEDMEYDLEDKLEDILSKMTGVGKVKVLITYSQTSSIVPMYSQSESINVTEETDSAGGTRKQESSNINKEIITDGESNVVTQTVVYPKVEGAIVIAEGGANAQIKSNIIQAVSVVTGVATYKVQVFEMER